MEKINHLYRKRIGFPEDETLTFKNLPVVLEKTAMTIPFENFCVIAGDQSELNEQSVTEKILHRNEGGLCYELNAMLYLFLKENGFDVQLFRGVVFEQASNSFTPTGRTHVTILLNHEGGKYLVDTGFGGNVPLQPVPLDGTEVSTRNGEYRVKKEDSEYGDSLLELKLKHKDPGWRKGYAFDTQKPVEDFDELNEVKEIITWHPESHFRERPLMTKFTEDGTITLTEASFTQWKNGEMTKEEISPEQFEKLLKKYF
ncbi:arylamine N-acetyltransferase [Bacillus sp. REN3]|uniref:arylamine N-acetyltransferase family protein n=1 Tax=Bacillus sp. REN3 TaxID=2802440 RepID=UPI001AEE0796|nr:arylamine N-acetyltransferase [Bacillus sp. REN3]